MREVGIDAYSQRSNWRVSPSAASAGFAQQISPCPSETSKAGGLSYATAPCNIFAAQVPQLPRRQLNAGANPRDSARSSNVPACGVHRASFADLTNATLVGSAATARTGERSAVTSCLLVPGWPKCLSVDPAIGHLEDPQAVVDGLRETSRPAHVEVVVVEGKSRLQELDADPPFLVVVQTRNGTGRFSEQPDKSHGAGGGRH
jgi:hypothetical protein